MGFKTPGRNKVPEWVEVSTEEWDLLASFPIGAQRKPVWREALYTWTAPRVKKVVSHSWTDA